MSIVLVCGGRDYDDREFLDAYLDAENRLYNFSHVIHGGYDGADTLAHRWALRNGIQPVVCEANWKLYGSKAGPIRNMRMAELKPHWAYAFPGGPGTQGMIEILQGLGIEVDCPVRSIW